MCVFFSGLNRARGKKPLLYFCSQNVCMFSKSKRFMARFSTPRSNQTKPAWPSNSRVWQNIHMTRLEKRLLETICKNNSFLLEKQATAERPGTYRFSTKISLWTSRNQYYWPSPVQRFKNINNYTSNAEKHRFSFKMFFVTFLYAVFSLKLTYFQAWSTFSNSCRTPMYPVAQLYLRLKRCYTRQYVWINVNSSEIRRSIA